MKWHPVSYSYQTVATEAAVLKCGKVMSDVKCWGVHPCVTFPISPREREVRSVLPACLDSPAVL